MLELNNVKKAYGKKVVLDNINLSFDDPAGVYGILGRNGVGKTTLMGMITNAIVDYSGEITYQGQSVKDNSEALSAMIYVGGIINNSDGLLNGKITNVIKTYAKFYPNFDQAQADQLLERFNISKNAKFKTLSTGNKTLVQNIIGLAAHTSITILDEPTNGLDSVNRQIFFEYLMESYQTDPRLFILSTHLIQEVEPYLTHVIMLKATKVLLDTTLEEIQTQALRITQGPVENKNVIKKQTLGSQEIYDIYDHLSDEERQKIISAGGSIEQLGLQTLFNDWMEV